MKAKWRLPADMSFAFVRHVQYTKYERGYVVVVVVSQWWWLLKVVLSYL